jgi:hypothetical protein
MNVVSILGRHPERPISWPPLVAGTFAKHGHLTPSPGAILVFKAAQARAENAHLCDDGCLRR